MGEKLTLLQVEEEIRWLADIVRREKCQSILEIGSKYGESLKILAHQMNKGSRVVAVDLPMGTREWSKTKSALEATVASLKNQGYDSHLIWGDSTAEDVIERVRRLGPYDLIFIDANHTLPYVTQDWLNYGPMGKIVAFHDIAWRRAPEWVGVRIDVPQFWDSLKQYNKTEEIRACPTGKNNGIGVVWRSP